jgi:DNA-binding MarR family transcriptional regulator
MLRRVRDGPANGRRATTIRAMTPMGPLTDRQMTAWRLFLRAHAVVTRRLEADLLAEHGLPLASYDVLVQLVEAPMRRLRMSELAERVLLSRSGLTRLVDRLEREGLVRREACTDDARGLFTVVTAVGVTRLREASPTHLHGVLDHAMGRLEEQEVGDLALLLARLLGEDEEALAGAAPGAQVSPAG